MLKYQDEADREALHMPEGVREYVWRVACILADHFRCPPFWLFAMGRQSRTIQDARAALAQWLQMHLDCVNGRWEVYPPLKAIGRLTQYQLAAILGRVQPRMPALLKERALSITQALHVVGRALGDEVDAGPEEAREEAEVLA